LRFLIFYPPFNFDGPKYRDFLKKMKKISSIFLIFFLKLFDQKSKKILYNVFIWLLESVYTNFHTPWTKISGSLEPRTSKIFWNLALKSILTHVRALAFNKPIFTVLTIYTNFNPLSLGVRAAGGHKKSYKACFPMNSQYWQHGRPC